MITITDFIVGFILIKDGLMIIGLYHLLNQYYTILNHELFWSIKLSILIILQYSIIPLRYKMNYFNYKLNYIHKIFSYEYIFNSFFGQNHLYLFYHEYYILNKIYKFSVYEKDSYLNDALQIINYNKLIINDFIIKPDYDCPICLCDNNNWIILPCSHKTHAECIKKWFNTSSKRNCPLCMNECNDEFINLLI